MLKLHGKGRTRWVKPYWVLRELDLSFEAITAGPLSAETQTPAFLALNPLAKVPVLEDDGQAVFESSAICAYLADKHHDRKRLIPEPGTLARARHDQWVSVAVTELEQPLWRIARHTFVYPEAKRSAAEIELARGDFRATLKRIAPFLERETLLESFTVADVTMAYTLRWGSSPAVPAYADLLDDAPAARAYLERQCARPAFPRELYA